MILSSEQAALGLHAISDLSRSTGTQSTVLLGDFNSLPDDPVYRFLRDGHVTEETRRMILDQTDKDDLEQYSAVSAQVHKEKRKEREKGGKKERNKKIKANKNETEKQTHFHIKIFQPFLQKIW